MIAINSLPVGMFFSSSALLINEINVYASKNCVNFFKWVIDFLIFPINGKKIVLNCGRYCGSYLVNKIWWVIPN